MLRVCVSALLGLVIVAGSAPADKNDKADKATGDKPGVKAPDKAADKAAADKAAFAKAAAAKVVKP